MQNFIKTIISALQVWVSSKINENNTALVSTINKTTDDIVNSFDNKIKNVDNKIDEIDNKIDKNVPDWNQNDESAAGYIKNRPFYEKTYYKVCIREQPIFLESRNNYNIMYGELGWSGTYRVTFDGIVYDNIIMEEDVAGEDAWLTIDLNSGEQIQIFVGLSIENVPDTLFGKHLIKIEELITEITHIDNKFMPFSVYSGEGNNAVILNNKNNIASGYYSHAEGLSTTASGNSSHAEGCWTKASGDYSHAEGFLTKAFEDYSHAEGSSTTASGQSSHTEGIGTIASGANSHAEGHSTTASGESSHAEGISTIASGKYSHVQGQCNIEDTEDKYAHIVGNGKFNNKRSNAHTIDWDGNAWYSGDVYVGSTSGINRDEGSKKLATEEYVNTIEAKIPTTPEAVGADPAGSALESLVEAKSYADTAVAALVNSAPETLDTLGELATAFQENADMVATLDAAVTNKAEKSDLDNLAELVDLNATSIESLQAQVLPASLILADAITGKSYIIQIQNGQLVSFETPV